VPPVSAWAPVWTAWVVGHGLLNPRRGDRRGRSGQLVLDVDVLVQLPARVAASAGDGDARQQQGRRRGRMGAVPC
jgi:hypothetical protein